MGKTYIKPTTNRSSLSAGTLGRFCTSILTLAHLARLKWSQLYCRSIGGTLGHEMSFANHRISLSAQHKFRDLLRWIFFYFKKYQSVLKRES